MILATVGGWRENFILEAGGLELRHGELAGGTEAVATDRVRWHLTVTLPIGFHVLLDDEPRFLQSVKSRLSYPSHYLFNSKNSKVNRYTKI